MEIIMKCIACYYFLVIMPVQVKLVEFSTHCESVLSYFIFALITKIHQLHKSI